MHLSSITQIVQVSLSILHPFFCAILTPGRIPCSRPAPDRFPLCDKELDTFSSFGTGKWIRETQLYSPLVGSRNVPGRGHPRFSVDPKSYPIQLTYLGPAKGDLWRRRIGTALHHRSFIAQTCPAFSSPDFLLCSVRAATFISQRADNRDVISVLTYVSFFVTICYHTIYARPWIYPPLAFYGLDLFLRLFRYRFKNATLTNMADMTIVCS